MTLKPYYCTATVIGSKYLGVFWAETEDDAINMAIQSDEAQINLCHQCSVECEDAEVDDVSAELATDIGTNDQED